MKFFRKNGEPAMNTNSGMCASSKPKVRRNSLMKSPSVTSQTAPPSANTSHTGTSRKTAIPRADQRALGETEMIIDQQMDVGDVGLARDLVEKNPDQNGDVDGQHQAPGVFPHTQIHSAPEND